MKKLLYVGWIGFGNLGDELLYHEFKRWYRILHPEAHYEIIPSAPGIDFKNLLPYDAVVLGGGSLVLPGYLAILQQAYSEGKKVMIWGSGIDWLEEQQLAALLSEEKPTSIASHFSAKDTQLMQEAIGHAHYAGVRGPLTQKVLQTVGIDETLPIIGDPGLLMAAPSKVLPKEKHIGINWGTTYNRLYGGHEENVENALLQVCKKLLKQGYKLTFYIVWKEDIPACKRLLQKINDANATLDETLYSEEALMTQLSRFQMTINFKLHANLLSLTAGVPCVALGYRFKVFDLFHSLDLQNYVVSTGSPSFSIDVMDCIRLIEQQTPEILHTYEQKKQVYLPLLKQMIQSLH
ncbi:hypothetical protein A374_03879 [Fictibacillus macauensis ZFHKF-1]|uniref:Polysaccharide pyruvyl transferase domain-containing protein n=1 Tax=Fictibacillus macauensis ZFHKF-1 TaxID=1196324 RepID=I8UIG1_9BACL|nr:polysaccharide pyruvyl transferase family protein [Fictibacillus macauensis]EIT86680.1 hypothetical protein A374_03879 [Fictibacillus macauensis ZFHKF-1]